MKIAFLSVLLLFIFSSVAPGAEIPGPTAESNTRAEVSTRSFASPISGAIELIYLPTAFPNYQWSNGASNEAKYSGFRLGFEWIPFGDMPYGKPVFGVSTGLTWISGVGLTPGTKGSLAAFPVEPYIGYRADIFKNQILVPYGKLGLGYAYIHEEIQVADGKREASYNYLGLDLSVGAELWLNYIDRKSARSLDTSTGINNVYLLLEYLKSRDLGAKYANLSREELRLGMRFEF